ncbi:hypothetical protein EV181_006818 [Coemansia sp. RSA 532]|nr:hypothetical protein EV181_006818 [Coemansia sp. RSA 532]
MYHDYQEKQRPEKYNDHEPAHTKRPVQIINSLTIHIRFTNWYMSAQSSAFASDHIFGNGWMPGSTRRTVVKEADSTWNIGRNDRSVSISCALGISLFIALLGTILQLSS